MKGSPIIAIDKLSKDLNIPDCINKVYGELTITGILGYKYSSGEKMWVISASCSCGESISTLLQYLTRHGKVSCGHTPNLTVKRKTVMHHNMTGYPIYRCWRNMKERCYNKKVKNYKDYGGRGITVCERWKNSFINFHEDMKDGYMENLSIDRIRVNDGYSKDNCKWYTMKEQNNNQRKTVYLTINGETKNANEWGRIRNVTGKSILCRINKHGWNVEDAVLLPHRGKYGRYVKKEKVSI